MAQQFDGLQQCLAPGITQTVAFASIMDRIAWNHVLQPSPSPLQLILNSRVGTDQCKGGPLVKKNDKKKKCRRMLPVQAPLTGRTILRAP